MTRLRMAAIACWLFVAVLAASGCGRFSRVGQSFWPQAAAGGPQVTDVLERYRLALELSPAEIDREISRLRAIWRREQSDKTLFHLVTLALQPGRPSADRRLALDLLTEYRRHSGGRDDQGDLFALAGLLADQARELLRLAEEREEARARAADLEEKLRALENIEKILRQREEGLSPGAEEKMRP